MGKWEIKAHQVVLGLGAPSVDEFDWRFFANI